jgi:ElaB/YqjD/DUF883 family membrane-anchored ribosome-binding protein
VALLVFSPAAGAAGPATFDAHAIQQSGTAGSTQQQVPPQGTPPPATGQENAARDRALAHLTTARDRLVEITKMPETQKLQGATRTELNALITDFNALVTSTGSEWKDNFQKVRQHMTTLLSRKAGTSSAGEAGQAGAVGTSGAVALDPAIEAKLTEMNGELDLFAQEAGVTGAGSEPRGTTGAGAMAGEGAPTEVERHLDAIRDLVDQALAANPQTGEDAPVTIDRAKLDEMLRHVQQLRQAIKDKR